MTTVDQLLASVSGLNLSEQEATARYYKVALWQPRYPVLFKVLCVSCDEWLLADNYSGHVAVCHSGWSA